MQCVPRAGREYKAVYCTQSDSWHKPARHALLEPADWSSFAVVCRVSAILMSTVLDTRVCSRSPQASSRVPSVRQ